MGEAKSKSNTFTIKKNNRLHTTIVWAPCAWINITIGPA